MKLKNKSQGKQKAKNSISENLDKLFVEVGRNLPHPGGATQVKVKKLVRRVRRTSTNLEGTYALGKTGIRFKIIGTNQFGRDEIISQLKSGLPVKAFDSLRTELGVQTEALTEIINMSTRTLARRRISGNLSSGESEKVYRIAQLIDLATRVLGDKEKGKRWLTSPKKALKDKTPLEYAETELGAKEVENLLGRLEHGIFT